MPCSGPRQPPRLAGSRPEPGPRASTRSTMAVAGLQSSCGHARITPQAHRAGRGRAPVRSARSGGPPPAGPPGPGPASTTTTAPSACPRGGWSRQSPDRAGRARGDRLAQAHRPRVIRPAPQPPPPTTAAPSAGERAPRARSAGAPDTSGPRPRACLPRTASPAGDTCIDMHRDAGEPRRTVRRTQGGHHTGHLLHRNRTVQRPANDVVPPPAPVALPGCSPSLRHRDNPPGAPARLARERRP